MNERFLFRTIKASTLLLLGLVGVSGCSVKEQAKIIHEKQSKQVAELKTVEVKALNKDSQSLVKTSNQEYPVEEYPALWERYKNLLTKSSVLNSSQRNEIYDLNKILEKFLVRSHKTSDHKMSDQVSKDYMRLLKDQGCLSGESCPVLKFLNQIPNSSGVFFNLAKKQEDIVEKYYFLTLSIDLQNVVENKEMVDYYKGNFFNLQKVLEERGEKELLKKYTEVLLYMQKEEADTTKLANQLQIWNFNRNKNNYEKIKSQEKLFQRYLEKNLLVCQEEICQVNPKLVQGMSDHLPEKNTLSLIKKFKSKYKFDMEKISLQEKNFFFFESVFYEIYSYKEATAFFKSSGQTFSEFWMAAKEYLKLKIILQTLDSNAFFEKQFYGKGNFTSSNLFHKAMTNSQLLIDRWGIFWSRIERIRNVTVSLFNKTFVSEEIQSQIHSVFINTKENIKYIAVYPNMIALIYKLSKNNFSFTFQTFWGPRTFKTDLVARLFFNGELSPWFNFGNDSQKLNQYGIVNSFYYALKTGIFDTYNINIKDFFRRLTIELMEPPRKALEELKTDLRLRVIENPKAQRLLLMCKKIQKNQPYTNRVNLFSFRNNIFLNEANDYSNYGDLGFLSAGSQYTDTKDRNSLASSDQSAMMPVGDFHTDTLEEIRLVYMRNIRLLRQLIKVYEVFLEEEGMTKEEIDKQTQNLKTPLDKFNKSRRDFLKKYQNVFEKYMECAHLYKKYGFDHQMIFLRQEEQYLRTIYRKMKEKAKNGDLSKEKVSHFPSLDGWTGFDFIKGDRYYYHELDAQYRMVDRVKSHYSPNIEVTYPISMSTDENFKEAVDKSKKKELIFIDQDEEGFVEQGLQAFYSFSPYSHHNWFATYNVSYKWWPAQLPVLVLFLRMSEDSEQEHKWREKLIDTIKDYLKQMWLSEEDISILKKLRIRSRYSSRQHDILTGLFSDLNDYSPIGFFDKIFSYTISPELGYYYDQTHLPADEVVSDEGAVDPRLNQWDEMTMIAVEQKNQRYNIWSLPSKIENYHRQVGEHLFTLEIGGAQKLYKRILEEKERHQDNSNNPDTPWKLMLDIDRKTYGPFLDPSAYLKFHSNVNNLHQKTDGFYKELDALLRQ